MDIFTIILLLLVVAALGLGGYAMNKAGSAVTTAELSSVTGKQQSTTAELSSQINSISNKVSTVSEEMSVLMKYNKVGEMGTTTLTAANTHAGNGARVDVFPIKFTKAYNAPPQVLITPLQMDVSTPPNLRYTLSAQNITTTGFNLNLSTWADTVLWSVVVQWATIV